eukprot:308086-Prorocentrum_minimum.AAC.2
MIEHWGSNRTLLIPGEGVRRGSGGGREGVRRGSGGGQEGVLDRTLLIPGEGAPSVNLRMVRGLLHVRSGQLMVTTFKSPLPYACHARPDITEHMEPTWRVLTSRVQASWQGGARYQTTECLFPTNYERSRGRSEA